MKFSMRMKLWFRLIRCLFNFSYRTKTYNHEKKVIQSCIDILSILNQCLLDYTESDCYAMMQQADSYVGFKTRYHRAEDILKDLIDIHRQLTQQGEIINRSILKSNQHKQAINFKDYFEVTSKDGTTYFCYHEILTQLETILIAIQHTSMDRSSEVFVEHRGLQILVFLFHVSYVMLDYYDDSVYEKINKLFKVDLY